MDRGELYTFMRRFRYGVVSSAGPAEGPQSALVGIATTPELEIVFDTLRSTRKYANLTARPACTFVVGGWDSEQTVQFEGVAVEPAGEELKRIREAYFTVWPDGRERLNWQGLMHFLVRPTWIRFSDFDQRPALIQEFQFPV